MSFINICSLSIPIVNNVSISCLCWGSGLFDK